MPDKNKQENIETTTEQKENEKQLPTKKERNPFIRQDIKTLLLNLGKLSFILLLFVIASFITIWLIDYKTEDNVKLKQDNNTFHSPFTKQKRLLKTFRFSTLRKDDKELKIPLNNPKMTVLASIFLAYDDTSYDLIDELNRKETRIIDKIQYIIASKDYRDINTVQKRQDNLKLELINEINSFLKQGKIEDIYFTYFFIKKAS